MDNIPEDVKFLIISNITNSSFINGGWGTLYQLKSVNRSWFKTCSKVWMRMREQNNPPKINIRMLVDKLSMLCYDQNPGTSRLVNTPIGFDKIIASSIFKNQTSKNFHCRITEFWNHPKKHINYDILWFGKFIHDSSFIESISYCNEDFSEKKIF